jgi:peptidoglycan hydrolase-like protein with peptidoglycan-binding domain
MAQQLEKFMSNLLKSKFLLGVLTVAVMFVGLVAVNPASAAAATCSTGTTTLRVGSRGDAVKCLQLALDNGITADGVFGPKTKARVMTWQASMGLTADGVFGAKSRAALVANGSMSGNFPAGCQSASGYSSTTGMPCNSGPSTGLPAGCSSTSGFSATTGQPCNGTTVNNGPVAVSLASNNPAAGTLVAGQATADLAHFTFTGNGTVTGVTLQRLGVSGDATLSNVYLFDGATRLTDAASVSNNGMVTFSVPSGLFTVNGSKTISVKSDIAGSTQGQTVGVMLASFTTASGSVTANLSGNVHTIATATLATVSAGTVTPSGATLNPGAGVTVWQSTLNVSQRDVWMKRIALRQIGSAPASAFANFKLYVNGVQVGTATGLDAMGYVTFDMSATPVLLASGSRVVRVDADIVSGASRTVNFSVRQAADVDFVDSSYGVNITPTGTSWVATASTIGGTSGGSMTVEKDTTSPTQPITLGGNDVKLGTFKVTAYGEAIKIETLRASYDSSDNTVSSLRNGKIKINGVQYGSTATLLETSNGVGYTSYTVNYTVMPGTPVLIDVYADMNDNDGTDNLSNGDTFIAQLVTGSGNALKQDSLGTINVPSATVSANTITANSATVTLVKNGTYTNQTVALPQPSGYKIGAWNLTGSSVEDVLITTLSFDVTPVTNATFSSADLTNLAVVIKDSNGNIVASPSPLGTVSATGNSFSVNYTLAKNASATVELRATLGSTVTAADSFKTTLTVTGTASVSGTAVAPAAVDGQTIISGTGSITATLDASRPDAAKNDDMGTKTMAAFKFAAVTDSYTITDLTFTVADATTASMMRLFDGATEVASKAVTPAAGNTTFNGLNWTIPAGQSKVLTVKLDLGTVGSGAGTTGASTLVTLTAGTATSGAGVSAAITESNPAGTAQYTYKSIPTVALGTLPTTALSAGTNTLAKFSVNTNGTGTVAWNRMIFTIAKTSAPTIASVTVWNADSNTQIAGTADLINAADAATCVAAATQCRLRFVPTTEQQVSGSVNYVVKATVGGSLVDNDYISTTIAAPSVFAASDTYANVAASGGFAATYVGYGTSPSFIWSDVSADSHATTTADWTNDFLIRQLPTDSQTLTF